MFGFVNRRGQVVIQPQFYHAWAFAEGLAPVAVGNSWGFIDLTGTLITRLQFERPSYSFAEGLVPVSVD